MKRRSRSRKNNRSTKKIIGVYEEEGTVIVRIINGIIGIVMAVLILVAIPLIFFAPFYLISGITNGFRPGFDYNVIAYGTEIELAGLRGRDFLSFSRKGREMRVTLHIPTYMDDIPVTGIGSRAFQGYVDNHGRQRRGEFREVTLPDGLTYIGRAAFRMNRITNVNIPDSVVYIGEMAFYNNYIITVSIPRHTSVAVDAFDADVAIVWR